VKSGRAARARSESRQRFNPVHFRTRKAATTNGSLHDELSTGQTSITGKIRHATRADNTAEAKTGGIILRGARLSHPALEFAVGRVRVGRRKSVEEMIR